MPYVQPEGDAFRVILNNFEQNSVEGEYFNNFYQRKVTEDKMYFFSLLKPFTVLPEELPEDYFTDWGDEEKYVKAIGVGECAGVFSECSVSFGVAKHS